MGKFWKKHWLLILILVGILIDQGTKNIAVLLLTGQGNVWMIDNFFAFTLVYNTGAAWGMFAGQRWFLILGPILVTIACLVYYFRSKKTYINVGLVVVITGALGNLIDRIVTGEVVDFLDFYIFNYDFPVFNFADMCITLGCIYLMICLVFEKEESKNA